MLVFYLLAVLEQKKKGKEKRKKGNMGQVGTEEEEEKKRGLGLPESRGVALFCLVVVFGSLSHPGLSLLSLSLLSTLSLSLSLSRH